MPLVDAQGLTPGQAEFIAHLREVGRDPEAWLLFVNAGFSVPDALELQKKGLIETSMQMGMPAARLNTWIEHDSEQCPVDDEQRVMVRWKDPDETGVITTHRAGAFNWKAIRAYRLEPNPEHAR